MDLVAEFALPVPSLVICELLGVPYADRATFQVNSTKFLIRDAADRGEDGRVRRADHVPGPTGRRASGPSRARISCPTWPAQDDLSIEELTGIAFLLLLAGHETTANMLGLGTFALLEHPDQAACCAPTRS